MPAARNPAAHSRSGRRTRPQGTPAVDITDGVTNCQPFARAGHAQNGRVAARWCECATDVQICSSFVHVIRMCRFHVRGDFRSRKTTRRGSCDQRAVLPGVKLSGMGCTRRPSQKPFARRAQDSVYCDPTQPIVGSESGCNCSTFRHPWAGRVSLQPLPASPAEFGAWNGYPLVSDVPHRLLGQHGHDDGGSGMGVHATADVRLDESRHPR